MKNALKSALLLSALTITSACAAPTTESEPTNDEATSEALPSSSEEGEVAKTSEALTSGLVASRPIDGMILSTGNIYFTTHEGNYGEVYRTGQTSNAGVESRIGIEYGQRFGDITYALVGGVYYGYVLAQAGGVTTIRRVPLDGVSATPTPIATVNGNIDIVNTHRNLVTDGTSLFFQTDVGVYQLPVAGGTPTLIASTNPNTPTAGLAIMNGTNLIYADGATIYSWSIAGTPLHLRGGTIIVHFSTTVVTAPTRVTTLYAVSNGIYWGDNNGDVEVTISGTSYPQPSAGGVPTSIGTNGYTAGAAQLWTQCAGSTCKLQHAFPAGNWWTAIGANAFGAAVNSSGNGFYADAAGIHREVY